MRSTLALLLLFGAVIGDSPPPPCTLYELPTSGICEKILKWKVHDHDQALATCLEYFPTTFVKGKMEGNTVKCTVKAAYQCLEDDTFPMFDKCYKFPKDGNGKYISGKMADYNKPNGLCGDGKLSVFYSSDHAKFVGMKAHKLGIDKLWIGITADGKTIEEPKMKIHSKLWNLVEDDYWQNGKLQKGKPADGVANYFFMRTDTDYVLGRWQGKFEQTDGNNEAAFACEYESKYLADQKWYCEKLPALGIDSVYDDSDESQMKQPRCLYVTASKYTFNGKYEDMKNIKGCLERPSDLHSTGMDDGTGKREHYEYLMRSNGGYKGLLRVASYKAENEPDINGFKRHPQIKCTTGVVRGSPDRMIVFTKWRHIGHHGEIKPSSASQVQWSSNHPANECSDFPGDSSTMGMKDGKKIDMPPQVRAPAICSLKFFQVCEQEKPCGAKQECTNVDEYNKNTGNPKNPQGFFKCQCPGPRPYGVNSLFDEGVSNNEPTCTWKSANDQYCAWLRFHGDSTDRFALKGTWSSPMKEDLLSGRFENRHNDMLNQVVVRDGCKIDILAASLGYGWNHELLNQAGYGTHHVPNYDDGTLEGDWKGEGASAYICRC